MLRQLIIKLRNVAEELYAQRLWNWPIFKWIKKSTAKTLPNKCDVCGLRVTYDRSNAEAELNALTAGKLDQYGLVTYAPRVIEVGGGKNLTSYCAVANVKYWNQPKRRCPDWQMKLPGISLSDYVSVHEARTGRRLAAQLGWLTFVLSIAGVLVAALLLAFTIGWWKP
jgi:hypothetical protein